MQIILKGHSVQTDIHSVPKGVYKQEKSTRAPTDRPLLCELVHFNRQGVLPLG